MWASAQRDGRPAVTLPRRETPLKCAGVPLSSAVFSIFDEQSQIYCRSADIRTVRPTLYHVVVLVDRCLKYEKRVVTFKRS